MASIPSSSGSIARTFGLRSSRQLESKLRRLLAHGRDDLLLICLCGDDRIYHQQANCTAFDRPFHQRSRTAPVGIACAEDLAHLKLLNLDRNIIGSLPDSIG